MDYNENRNNQGGYNPNGFNQGGYAPGPYNNGGYNNGMPPKPSNYLVFSILCTVCCCLPTGIAAIIYSSQVDSAYNAGNYNAAVDSASKAKTWCIVSVVVSLLVNIVYIVFWGGAIYASLLDI